MAVVVVLPDSFEHPLSRKKTANSRVAIAEPTSTAVLWLALGTFGFGNSLGAIFPCGFESGLLSGLPDNPSCVKNVMLISYAGSPVRSSRSKIGAVKDGLISRGLWDGRSRRAWGAGDAVGRVTR